MTPDAELERLLERLAGEKSFREELASAYAQLRRAEEMQGSVLARLNHELRTPLSVALGSLEVLSQDLPDSARPRLETARSAIKRLSEAVEDLLRFADLTRDSRKPSQDPVDAAALLRRVVADYARLYREKDLEVLLAVPEDLPSVPGDAALLRSALMHLTVNAALFCRPGGFVRFAGRRAPRGLAFTFENEGERLDESELERIFDPFYQIGEVLTRSVRGLGLGLAIVREVASRHGGAVQAFPRQGGGAVFTFVLPTA